MGSQTHGMERAPSPIKLPSKQNKQKMTAKEVSEALEAMKRQDIVPFLKSHHLLQNCSKLKPAQLPTFGDMVWARNYGSVYWPAFVAKLEDRVPTEEEERMDYTACTFVMFLEETFRFAALPWEQIIQFQDVDVQKVLIPKFNKIVKSSWKPSTGYKKAMQLIDDFWELPASERQKAAEAKFYNVKQKYSKKNNTPKKVTTPAPAPEKPTPVAQEISKVVSSSKNKKKSGLRVSDRIVQNQIVKIKTQSEAPAKQKTEEPEKEKTPAKPVKPNKNARPDVGGEVLKEWTQKKFDSISKQYIFESTKNVLCRHCDKEFEEGEEIKTCHGLPHHSKCLNSVNGSTTMKCSRCIGQLCFLCNEPHDSKNALLKCSRCDLRYHINCLLNEWPQAEIQGSNGPLTCPLHFCHSCLGEQKIFGKFRDYTTNPSRAYKCLFCLSTYHKTCLPAGCGEDIHAKEYIICPRHRIPELKSKQRRIGCLGCCKALKPKEDRVECLYCIQAFHPACVGYTGEICERLTLEVFAKGYKCYSCRWGLFPLYGQVVWYQQPQSQYWPARILYPNESKRRTTGGIKRTPGEYSVEYFGETSFYDHACRGIPLHLTTIEIFKIMKVYQDTPKILRAHEEAAFFFQFAEKYRDSILQQPKPIYKKIERNVYRTIPVQKVKEPSDVCSCSESDKSDSVCIADSGCTNRDMEMECSDRICKGGSRCANRMFTERKNDDEFLQQRLFPNKGWGVIAKQRFNPGDFVSEYRGEVIDRAEMLWRLNKKEEEDPMYILEISKEFFIDAEYIGNLSRLINHSCDPNSEVRKYLSQGRNVGGIFAKRVIEVGEEVTFDYGCGSQSTAPFRCRCGAKNCLVFVGKEVPEDFHVDEDNDVNVDKWDDVCSKCGYGGRVICCEFPGCGKVYHYHCIKLSRPPRKNWCCPLHPQKAVELSRKKLSNSTSSRSKQTSRVRVKSTKSKTNKTEEAGEILPSEPKKQSQNSSPQSMSLSPKLNKSTSKADVSNRIPKRKLNAESNDDVDEGSPPLKKLKTSENSPEQETLVVQLPLSSLRRQLRSSKASDSAETPSAVSEVHDIDTQAAPILSLELEDKMDDVSAVVSGEPQPELMSRRSSISDIQVPITDAVTPITRSSLKRKHNGTSDYYSCESSPAKTDEDEKTDSSTMTMSTIDESFTPETVKKIDFKVTKINSNKRRNTGTSRGPAPRNNKLSEPFSPLVLNSNVPPAPRARVSLLPRDVLSPTDKNGQLRVGMKTRSSSNGSYTESQKYGENSRRSSTSSLPNLGNQPVVALTDINLKRDVTNGFNEPIISEQKFPLDAYS